MLWLEMSAMRQKLTLPCAYDTLTLREHEGAPSDLCSRKFISMATKPATKLAARKKYTTRKPTLARTGLRLKIRNILAVEGHTLTTHSS